MISPLIKYKSKISQRCWIARISLSRTDARLSFSSSPRSEGRRSHCSHSVYLAPQLCNTGFSRVSRRSADRWQGHRTTGPVSDHHNLLYSTPWLDIYYFYIVIKFTLTIVEHALLNNNEASKLYSPSVRSSSVAFGWNLMYLSCKITLQALLLLSTF